MGAVKEQHKGQDSMGRGLNHNMLLVRRRQAAACHLRLLPRDDRRVGVNFRTDRLARKSKREVVCCSRGVVLAVGGDTDKVVIMIAEVDA